MLQKQKLSSSSLDNSLNEEHFKEVVMSPQEKIIPEPLPEKFQIDSLSNSDNNIPENLFFPPETKLSEKLLIYTLRTLDLENLFNKFNINLISFNDLFLLTKEDLVELKIPIGPRNRILNFSDEYKKTAKDFDLKELINFFNNHKGLIINKFEDYSINSKRTQKYSNNTKAIISNNNKSNNKSKGINNKNNEPLKNNKAFVPHKHIENSDIKLNRDMHYKLFNKNDQIIKESNNFSISKRENADNNNNMCLINDSCPLSCDDAKTRDINSKPCSFIRDINTIEENTTTLTTENKNNLNDKKVQNQTTRLNTTNSEMMQNFNNIFSEVENFQNRYQDMKIKNDLRKNKINNLLSQKKFTFMDNGEEFNEMKIKNKEINDRQNTQVVEDDLINENERNLNEELRKYYKFEIPNYSTTKQKNTNGNHNSINNSNTKNDMSLNKYININKNNTINLLNYRK